MKRPTSSRKAHASRWGAVLTVALSVPHPANLHAHDQRVSARISKSHGGEHD